jgi:hypothetical protein
MTTIHYGITMDIMAIMEIIGVMEVDTMEIIGDGTLVGMVQAGDGTLGTYQAGTDIMVMEIMEIIGGGTMAI